MKRAKSIFASKTFWFVFASFWVAIAPSVQAIADQERFPTSGEWVQIVTLLVTTGGAMYGRYSANTEVFTPQWLPGRSDSDQQV